MSKNESKISLTEEDLENIVRCFEMDRERVTQELNGADAESDMYLHLFKSFKEQILENQRIVKKIRDQRQYHTLCEGKFDSDSNEAKFHHLMSKELSKIENT